MQHHRNQSQLNRLLPCTFAANLSFLQPQQPGNQKPFGDISTDLAYCGNKKRFEVCFKLKGDLAFLHISMI